MSEAKKRKEHAPEFKAKVGLEALRGVKTINEIGLEYGVHPVQVGQWKKEIQEQAKKLVEVLWYSEITGWMNSRKFAFFVRLVRGYRMRDRASLQPFGTFPTCLSGIVSLPMLLRALG